MPAKGTGFAFNATHQSKAIHQMAFWISGDLLPGKGVSMECGSQFSLYPMTDQFVDVILPAVDCLKHRGLVIKTDDLSTLIRGEASIVFSSVRDAFIMAASSKSHVVANILFSRGCPGEDCGKKIYLEKPKKELPPAQKDYPDVSAQFSLYPLGYSDYMDQIYRAIDRAKITGTFTTSKNFCTRLDGSAVTIFQCIFKSFIMAPATHTVIHTTISANSPTRKGV